MHKLVMSAVAAFVLATLLVFSVYATGANSEFVWANVLAANIFTQVNTFQQGIKLGSQTFTAASATETKCANIDPTNATTTSWFVYEFEAASTITHIRCWSDVATSTVVMTPRICDANFANCSDVEAAITCTTSKTSESGAVDSPTVTAGQTLIVLRGNTANSPTQAFMCVVFTTP